jgi:hypothetical protein
LLSIDIVNMKFSIITSVASLATLATASPTPTIQKRADMCGQWDSVTTGTYTLYNVRTSHPIEWKYIVLI